jgi:hypothetical protein
LCEKRRQQLNEFPTFAVRLPPQARVIERPQEFPHPPKDTCALCGTTVSRKTGTRTKQHVPPDLLFPAEEKEGKVQLITVAACKTCNKQLSDDEERFRDDVMTLLGPAKIGDPRSEVYDRFQRGLMGKKEEELLDRLLPHDAGVEFLVPSERTDRVLLAVARGLSFKFFGRLIPSVRPPKNWSIFCVSP